MLVMQVFFKYIGSGCVAERREEVTGGKWEKWLVYGSTGSISPMQRRGEKRRSRSGNHRKVALLSAAWHPEEEGGNLEV